ncbi:hypothetical protein F5884DRAFT_816473 [Xylogone sp. PMI_703]|nr:hypothetical protein F5884DRAFT_816473 [Xylogone sp. PMI_703]
MSGINTAAPSLPDNKITSVRISEQERQSAVPSAATVGAAASILFRDGIVVLENAVSVEHIDTLNQKLVAEVPGLVADPNTHWNQGKEMGNISQPPPFTTDMMFADVWANPFTTAVISALVGPRPRVAYVNGNTALPHTTGHQNVHADLVTPYTQLPVALVANYYLCDTDDSNGATEVWLRSHQHTRYSMHQPGRGWIQPDALEERASNSGYPPIRPSVKRGSVVIRDLRLWHAGRGNPSAEPRIMLAFVYFPWWYQNSLKIRLPLTAKPLLDSFEDKVVYQAEYVDGGVDHTKVSFVADFSSRNEAYLATFESDLAKYKVNGH